MISSEIYGLDFDAYLAHIAKLTDEVLIPAEPEMVAAGEVPPTVVEALANNGLFGITTPRRYGGLEWNMTQQVRLTMEFTRASCVYRSRFSTTIGLCSQGTLDYGTDEQRDRLLPSMAAGETVAAFALTETEAGSDAGALTTTARRDGDEWVIDGHKRFITNGAWADVLYVFARTGTPESGANGVSTFIVPRNTPGVTTKLPELMNGHAEGPVAEIELRGVRVPSDALLGEEGKGMSIALRGINHARMHVSATSIGQATRLLEEAAKHVTRRKQFGAPLSELGAVQAELGRCYSELEAARALVLTAAAEFDQGTIPRHRIAAAKLFATEMVGRLADRCVQLLGGDGIVGDSPVPRMWRDVRALRIYEGSSPIHERNLGRAVVKQIEDDGTLPDTYRVSRQPVSV